MPIIYYVEDDAAIGYVIEKTIQYAGWTAKGFQKGNDFLVAYGKEKPDMILLDIMLPDMSGLDLIKKIRETNQDIPIMMISALHTEMDKVIALDLGADDYMVKPFGVMELTSRIQSKLRKHPDTVIYRAGNIELNDAMHQISIDHQVIALTNKEYDLLKLLISYDKRVVDRETIFKIVWGTHFIGETRTLDMHIASLRQKLQTAHASMHIKNIRGIGYSLE